MNAKRESGKSWLSAWHNDDDDDDDDIYIYIYIYIYLLLENECKKMRKTFVH